MTSAMRMRGRVMERFRTEFLPTHSTKLYLGMRSFLEDYADTLPGVIGPAAECSDVREILVVAVGDSARALERLSVPTQLMYWEAMEETLDELLN
jgi:hypothetical protein